MEEKARLLDSQDELAEFRDMFHIPLARDTYPDTDVEDDKKCIYFNGNSLGVMVSLLDYQNLKSFNC